MCCLRKTMHVETETKRLREWNKRTDDGRYNRAEITPSGEGDDSPTSIRRTRDRNSRVPTKTFNLHNGRESGYRDDTPSPRRSVSGGQGSGFGRISLNNRYERKCV
ncbi:hypothetical protein LSAT2_023615, partial [Lamellibrachia satsuma]